MLGCKLPPPVLWHSKGCVMRDQGMWEGLEGPGLSMAALLAAGDPAAPLLPPRRHRRSCSCAMLVCRLPLPALWHSKGCVMMGKGRWEDLEGPDLSMTAWVMVGVPQRSCRRHAAR